MNVNGMRNAQGRVQETKITTYLGKPNRWAILRWLKLGDKWNANTATVKIFDRGGLLLTRDFGGAYGPIFNTVPGVIPALNPAGLSNVWSLYFPFTGSVQFLRAFGTGFYRKKVQGFWMYSPTQKFNREELEKIRICLTNSGWKRP